MTEWLRASQVIIENQRLFYSNERALTYDKSAFKTPIENLA